MNFDEAFTRLMGHEGGFVDHPADPGGATCWGITERVARANGYAGSMRDLSQATAMDIARREYWDAVSADLLPALVRFEVFDGAYNSGAAQSIKWLQRAVYVTPDGVIGPKTLMAVGAYSGLAIAARYNGYRLDFMNDLKTWANFGRGWAQRIAENLIATRG